MQNLYDNGDSSESFIKSIAVEIYFKIRRIIPQLYYKTIETAKSAILGIFHQIIGK